MSERTVPMRCPSTHWGFAENASGTYRVRCRMQYCRTAEGEAVIHVFDLATGSFSTLAADEIARAERPEERHHGRNTTL